MGNARRGLGGYTGKPANLVRLIDVDPNNVVAFFDQRGKGFDLVEKQGKNAKQKEDKEREAKRL